MWYDVMFLLIQQQSFSIPFHMACCKLPSSSFRSRKQQTWNGGGGTLRNFLGSLPSQQESWKFLRNGSRRNHSSIGFHRQIPTGHGGHGKGFEDEGVANENIDAWRLTGKWQHDRNCSVQWWFRLGNFQRVHRSPWISSFSALLKSFSRPPFKARDIQPVSLNKPRPPCGAHQE